MNNSVESPCIFFLDNDPVLAAQALFDDDLKATILYLSIVTSCAIKEMVSDLGEEGAPSSSAIDWKKEGYTIYQHDIEPPADYDVIWIESTPSIWRWCSEYFRAMLAEHEYRFEEKHPSEEIVNLFDSDGELEKGQIDEFVPPSIRAVDKKFHVDANFRTYKTYTEKNKSKNKYKVNILNTFRHLYKSTYLDDKSGCDYTKRAVPVFIKPPQEENETRTGRAGILAPRPARWGSR